MGIILLSLIVAFANASANGVDLIQIGGVVLHLVAFFVAALVAGRGLPAVLAWAKRLPVSQGALSAAIVVALIYAWAAERAGGVAAITGAYIAGVLVAQTEFKREIDSGIHPLAYSIFVPVFFIGIGLQANGRELGGNVAFTITLVAVAIVAKAVGCAVAAMVCGFTKRQSLRVGVGMISRGEVGLIVAGYGRSHGLISQEVFSASVIVVLATTMVTPPLLRLVFSWQPHAVRMVEEAIAHPPHISK